ncbi:MAG: cytochrome P460 family protein [Cyanobacteria bacterium TGS_CYA1]|nr:cytochrome P460 family protein [Cyanobacteria bacterium TGS_CYA1]
MKSASLKLLAVLTIAVCFAPQVFCDTSKVTNDKQFHQKLLEIAAKYKSYGKVDDLSKWAPWLCSAPPPPVARISQSKDQDTHGRKLYFLYAQNRNEYVEKKAPQVGQTIVKEAWIPDDSQPPKPEKQSSIFIMTKMDPLTKNTDNGWIYGTVTPDGKTVTSAGRVETCMKCHLETKNDRLFGLKEQ